MTETGTQEPQKKEDPITPVSTEKVVREEGEKKGLTEEQVQELLNKARQQEKDKLYPQIEELRGSVKDMADALKKEQDEKDKIRKEAEKKQEEERKSKLSGEQLLQESLKRIEEQLANEREARAKLERELKDERRREQLEAYRIQKIKEAGSDIIPELVQGDSEKEIDASLNIAKARYAEVVEELKAKKGEEVKSGMPRPVNPDTAAHEEAELQNIDEIEIDVSRYTKDKEYRAEVDKKRDEIQARVSQAYARSVGR